MTSFSLLFILTAFVVVERSQANNQTASKHICYYLNKKEDVYIPIAAIFPFPKENRLLIFDHIGMYYDVGGKDDKLSVQLSAEKGVRISLEKASTGQWAVKWPELISIVADDTEAIFYNDKSWFCFFNKTENGKCFNTNSPESMEFSQNLLKHATSGDFHEKFQALAKCRVKSSLKSSGEFIMQFIDKKGLEEAMKDSSLECPVVWRTIEDFNAVLFEYENIVFIINLQYAYAFSREEMVDNGSTIVSRIHLKHLFHCDPNMVIRRDVFAFGLSLQSFLLLFVGALFVILILIEIAYIAGAFESPNTTDNNPETREKRVKKRKKKKTKPKTKKYIGPAIEGSQLEPSPSQIEEMQETEDNEQEESATPDTIAPSTGFSTPYDASSDFAKSQDGPFTQVYSTQPPPVIYNNIQQQPQMHPSTTTNYNYQQPFSGYEQAQSGPYHPQSSPVTGYFHPQSSSSQSAGYQYPQQQYYQQQQPSPKYQ